MDDPSNAGLATEEAVAALVFAVGGFLALPVVPSVMAIRTGLRARNRLADANHRGYQLVATAAIVLGLTELVVAVVLVVLLITAPTSLPAG